MLLVLHWLLVPLQVNMATGTTTWTGILSFSQVLIVWTMIYVARELVNPFGLDANDLDGYSLQMHVDKSLTMLIEARLSCFATCFLTSSTLLFMAFSSQPFTATSTSVQPSSMAPPSYRPSCSGTMPTLTASSMQLQRRTVQHCNLNALVHAMEVHPAVRDASFYTVPIARMARRREH